jgi:hypothetical protein
MVVGTLAERGRRCGKPTCRCVHGEKQLALPLVHRAGDGKTRSLRVSYALADDVRARGRVVSVPGGRLRARRPHRNTAWDKARRRGQVR